MDAAYTAYRELKIEENRKKRLRIVRRQRIALGIAIALIAFLFAFLGFKMNLQAHSEEGRYKYYSKITVHSGENLTSLSQKYISDEYKNADSYIKEVCAINNLDEDETIYAGESLIVPYYSDEYK